MINYPRKILFCFLFIFLSSAVYSLDKNNIKPEGEKSIGKADYSFLFFDVYSAKLWGSSNDINKIYQKPLGIELTYKMKLDGEDICKRSFSEILDQGNSKESVKRIKGDVDCIFPNIKAGDRILANYNPTYGLKFYLNGSKLLGGVKDLGDAKLFLNIWLGEKASDKSFRNKLLGVRL